jgi:hypothetical protein
MKKASETLKNELRNLCDRGIFPLFEIAVIDKRTNEEDWITFDIEITGDHVKATHVALSEEEERSEKIAFKAIEIQEGWNLDAHLSDLFDECQTAIIDSEFFRLSDN